MTRTRSRVRLALGLLVLGGLLVVLAYVFPWYMFSSLLTRWGYGRSVELVSPYRSENEWLMQTIARDLVEMVAWASDAQAFRARPPDVRFQTLAPSESAGSVPRLRLDVHAAGWATTTELSTPTFIWSPSDWAGTVRALLAAAKLGPATPTPDTVLPELLLDLRPETLASADQRVSARLERTLLEPSVHADAALVLGMLAWREAAGDFSDTRLLLARMAAHLALARALNPAAEARDSRALAEALLLTLGGRGAEARQALVPLARGTPSEQAWARALGTRLDDDWRAANGDTRLERLASFRALTLTLDTGLAQERLEAWGWAEDPATDWGRLALHTGASVEDGWHYADGGLPQELAELQRVRTVMHLTALAHEPLLAALDAPQERCITTDGPRALGWGAWAAAAQRHVAARELAADVHYRRMLDRSREADQRRAASARQLGGLRLQSLWALMQALYSTATRHPVDTALWQRGPMDRPLALMSRQPELVNARVWLTIALGSGGGRAWRSAYPAERWFAGGPPFGTTYDAAVRWQIQGTPSLAELLNVSPDEYLVQFREAQRLARLPATARWSATQALFARRVAYDGRALSFLRAAAGDDAAAALRLLDQHCQLDPTHCFALGAEHLAAADDASAARAFARACEAVRDRVMAAQDCGWYVGHLHAHGEAPRALELATELADTGAAGGLATLAAEHERRGAYDQAELQWRALRERYDSEPPYLGFLYRADVQQRQPAYKGRFARETGGLFPAGLEAAQLQDFSGPPRQGVVIISESARSRRAGLRAADVIVALDGWRVRGMGQYEVLRELRHEPEMTFILWRTPSYVEVRARLSDHRFRADIRELGE